MKFFASAFSETRARWFRFSLTPIILGTLLGLVIIGSGCSDDKGDTIVFPQPPAPDQREWIFDVFGTSATDVYACGNKGAMFHFDGTTWSSVDMGTSVPITTIWGPVDGPLYAAGHEGKLWQMSGGSWNSLNSGTTQDLFGLGLFDGNIHACGANGALRRLSGNTWASVPQVVVVRDPEGIHSPIDTLSVNNDVASLLTVNNYVIGGAYKLPSYEGEEFGMKGTDGMVLGIDVEPELYDWILRPLRGDQLIESEWIICSTSSVAIPEDNYLGTSEGWVFRLNEEEEWTKMQPDATVDSQVGIRDMWLDADSNLYFVTDNGELVFQTREYKFPTVGMRKTFPVTINGLTSIWGPDTDHLFMSGFTENLIIHASMDFSDTTLVFEEITVEFPNKGGQSIGMFEDHMGLPRR
jgi:hypothetical protein